MVCGTGVEGVYMCMLAAMPPSEGGELRQGSTHRPPERVTHRRDLIVCTLAAARMNSSPGRLVLIAIAIAITIAKHDRSRFGFV